MDLHRLRMLVAVAHEGTITAAAESLHTSQPSVSHHLARLEAEVGVPLLQRDGRGVRLTAAGALLVRRAEELLGRVEATRDELRTLAHLGAGRVRLAAFPSALATLVPAAVAALVRAHPGVDVELVEAEPPEALSLVRRGTVDVALVFEHDHAANDRHGLAAHPVMTDPVHLITPLGGVTADGATGDGESGGRAEHDGSAPEEPEEDGSDGGSDLARWRDVPWIAGCERCRADLLGRCERAGFTPRIAFETDDYVAVQALVAAGMGVSLLPGLALAAHRDPRVRGEAVTDAHRTVLAVTYADRPPPAAGALVDALVTAGRATAHPSPPQADPVTR
ncbi:DNA-binding transcriptional LysR family regulator [Sediminihabitans luteus]|uniref:DNA-binding transcriptional LysR family regulator n=1 Tax=Sediminihabitans luteus TaxID=1138585 RepID=A0A2M9CQV0_9CELL|nr:LysR substrate-binding domain-containing protein [Sediminihabitans luteus]PJJ74284.1 DNA-binding transcriptional LysR family regulator [Sediminihabitans luteus]GII99137.1 LysR family transcriptional regulator [Sediminihabitans luteus]